MADPRDALQSKFDPQGRFANFGDIIMRMRIRGFRCHVDTIIDIQSPITAFSGLNGTGKSTLIQIAAAAYKNANALRSYSIRDFMVRSALDTRPFTLNASAQFEYWTNQRGTKTVTLTRNDTDNRWNGYRSRPTRRVLFASIGMYIPKVDARDYPVRYARYFTVIGSNNVSTLIKDWTCRILGHAYDALTTNQIGHVPHAPSTNLISATRRGCSYSETHMGFGEARAQFIIHNLEALPDKSLVLLEEPETSLHQKAQHELGHYLIDVSNRKGHQIILTTHSAYLLSALPASSSKFLYPGNAGIEQLSGIAASQANSLLTDGYDKSLTIIVEDDCTAAVLSELLDRTDRQFRKTVHMAYPFGMDEIVIALKATNRAKLKVAAVLDGDAQDSPERRRQFIFKLPGSLPPEREMLASPDVKAYFQNQYAINIDDFLAANGGMDHHQYFSRLEEISGRSRSMLVGEAARIFAPTLPGAEVTTLVNQLKDAADR